MIRALTPGLVLLACAAACTPPPAAPTPSDDPADWIVPPGPYRPELGEPRWIVPSALLPPEVRPLAANNNVEIAFHAGRLYLAWRTAESHFASPNAKLYVVSSADDGGHWEGELEVALGSDVREPRLLSFAGQLTLHFFQGGTNPLAFEPRGMWRTRRLGPRRWTDLEPFGTPGEVPWTMKRRGDRALMTSYLGPHYATGPGALDVRLQVSTDGASWAPLDPARPVVYRGGVSEAAFELDARGDLWAVTRNEDGDASGFGSHLCRAPAARLADWTCPAVSDPERYDSPQLFRHGPELYLLARRDLGGPFDGRLPGLSFEERKARYLRDYSLRPKRTALYRVDIEARKIIHLVDLPSAGDTAFPSVRRTGEHTFLVANYTSPLTDLGISWLSGQVSAAGTQIYLLPLRFVASP